MKEITPYTVNSGKPVFDWRKALKKAISRKQKRSPSLTAKSKSWVTCACGNQCAVIPRDSAGGPRDNRLNRLGVVFYEHVSEGRFENGLKTLEEIEKRSSELLSVIYSLQDLKTEFDVPDKDLKKQMLKLQKSINSHESKYKSDRNAVIKEAESNGIYSSALGMLYW